MTVRQQNVRKVIALGERSFDEFLFEVGEEGNCHDLIDRKLERYAQIDPDILKIIGGDKFPTDIFMAKSS